VVENKINIVFCKDLLPFGLKPCDPYVIVHYVSAVHVDASVYEHLILRPGGVDDVIAELLGIIHSPIDFLPFQKLHCGARHLGVIETEPDNTCSGKNTDVDATAARLMQIEPRKIDYLNQAGEFLGNIAYDKVEQIGEKLEAFAQDFRVIESFYHLKDLVG
jgi:hypothetical protein